MNDINKTSPSMSDSVKSYINNGYACIPVETRSKKPIQKGWEQKPVKTDAEIEYYFGGTLPCNVGILTGSHSGGLIDVDIDHNDAIPFAKAFLPETASIFGREGRRSTHQLYRVSHVGEPKRFSSWSLGMIIEVRSGGQQTIFPPSINEDGFAIEFEENGLPSNTTMEVLYEGAAKVAIATLLLQSWKRGVRHHLTLAISALLFDAKWQFNDVEALIRAIAECAHDEELEDRLVAVYDTHKRYQVGKPISGRAALINVIGDQAIDDIEKWLNVANYSATNKKSNQDYSDASLADEFVKLSTGNLIYADSISQWYRKNNMIWRDASPVVVQGLAKDFLQAHVNANTGISKPPIALLSKSRINAVAELSRSRLIINTSEFDSNPLLFGCSDGHIFDLDRNRIVDGQTSEYVTKMIGAAYNPDAKCPTWRSFLNQIFENNQEIINFLKRAVGYSLTGLTREQCLFILIGRGANGKSTFINTIMKLTGQYATTLPMQSLMDSPFKNTHTDDLASLFGSRFVAASEGEGSQKLAEAKVKRMTGGDVIKCRNLYKNYFEYSPQFKLWLATNDLPLASGSDMAIWRRIRLINFPVCIPPEQQDQKLPEKLSEEISGILNWAIEGYHEWKMVGLSPPTEVVAATESYRVDNDPVGQWIDDCCKIESGARTSIRDLHNSFKLWSSKNSLPEWSDASFGKELTRKGFENKKGRSGGFRLGIKLVDSEDEYISIVEMCKSTMQFSSAKIMN